MINPSLCSKLRIPGPGQYSLSSDNCPKHMDTVDTRKAPLKPHLLLKLCSESLSFLEQFIHMRYFSKTDLLTYYFCKSRETPNVIYFLGDETVLELLCWYI